MVILCQFYNVTVYSEVFGSFLWHCAHLRSHRVIRALSLPGSRNLRCASQTNNSSFHHSVTNAECMHDLIKYRQISRCKRFDYRYPSFINSSILWVSMTFLSAAMVILNLHAVDESFSCIYSCLIPLISSAVAFMTDAFFL